MNRRFSVALSLFGAATALLVIGVAWNANPDRAAAAGSCGTSHDGMTAEESQVLQMVSAWRMSNNIPNAVELQASGPLIRAAAWFAEDIVVNGYNGGHIDSEGRNFSARALDCGYDTFWSGGTGEGVYAISGSGSLNIGPTEALSGLTYPGSGVYMSTPPNYQHVNCAGAAVYRNAEGTSVAWVVVLAQYDDGVACPEPGGTAAPPPASPSPSASISATATNTPTQTATATPTATATATPTQTSTPQARFEAKLDLVPGQWNLVTLPAGAMNEILARANGCYEAVYQMQAGEWRRYAPDVPGYARSLSTSDGGAFWIMATDKDCGVIDL